MKTLSSGQIAVALPITLLVHQLEEYLGEFPLWYSGLLGAQLSNRDFITINGIGFLLIAAFSLSYLFNKSNLILVAIGTLVFVNGIAHILLSLFTLSYSPGAITGVVLFLPLGIITYKRILPQLTENKRIIAISIGVVFLILVGIIARSV